jgi:hypothetical protein
MTGDSFTADGTTPKLYSELASWWPLLSAPADYVEGLFARADWLRLLADAGFRPSAVPFVHTGLEDASHEGFVGRRPLTPV